MEPTTDLSRIGVDEFLAHHGIKGMHWGVRKERTTADIQKELGRIDRKRNSLPRRITPASLIIGGAGARAGTAKKVLKLKEVKDANGNKRLVPTDKTPGITDLNRAAYDKKINRRTYAKYIGTGALVVGALLLTAHGSKSISDPEIAHLVAKGARVLAGAQAVTTAGVVVGVHRNIQDQALSKKRKDLQKELRAKSSVRHSALNHSISGIEAMMPPTVSQRKAWAQSGWAMPDGSYYIKQGSVSDLENAILAVGRGGADHDAIRLHIMKRARASDIKRPDLIPANWNPDGSLKHSDVDDFLVHFGKKGMKWGVRHDRKVVAGPPSADAKRVQAIATRAKTGGGIHTLSNKQLQDLVTRMNLETQYSKLETGPGSPVDSGRKFVNQLSTDGQSGIRLYKTGKEIAKILGPIILTVGAAAAANKATGGHVKYYHPSSRKALTA